MPGWLGGEGAARNHLCELLSNSAQLYLKSVLKDLVSIAENRQTKQKIYQKRRNQYFERLNVEREEHKQLSQDLEKDFLNFLAEDGLSNNESGNERETIINASKMVAMHLKKRRHNRSNDENAGLFENKKSKGNDGFQSEEYDIAKEDAISASDLAFYLNKLPSREGCPVFEAKNLFTANQFA